MTLPEHWRHLHAATAQDGILTLIERCSAALRPILSTASYAPGLDHLGRCAHTLIGVEQAIQAARTLAQLGCPKPGRGNTITLDPMEAA